MDYKQLLLDRLAFKSAAGSESNDFNLLDMPGHLYFKIFFHFDNGDSDYDDIHGGLLALPTADVPLIKSNTIFTDPEKGLEINTNTALSLDGNADNRRKPKTGEDVRELYDSPEMKAKLRAQSSAWSYLILNGEDERARLLLIFINLLLNISTNSPWYFQKISGLDTALERKLVMDHDFKLDELRLKITITCLPDAIDNRIGTLLDLYRSIVFSWLHKREIVPANLRKFDMSICIFETTNNSIYDVMYPNEKVPNIAYDKIGGFNKNTKINNFNNPTISYKYIELHNCEIDYGASKVAYNELNNAEGNNPEYTIDIYFDDIYESRYNQWCAVLMGDLLKSDLSDSLYSLGQEEAEKEQLQYRINNLILNGWPYLILKDDKLSKKKKKLFDVDKFLKGAKDQLIGLGKSVITSLINRVKLGNLFTFSLSNAKDGFNSFASGNILNTVRNVSNVVRKFDDNSSKTGISGNLFDSKTEEIDIEELKSLGNLFKAKSVQNNI